MPSTRAPTKTAAAASPAAPEKKMAVLLAERIQRDIAKSGWEVGHVVGNEATLIERYAVSRGTFREAVRQLERHGVATMRRGYGGGLTVQEPAHRAAVQALSTYLELTHVSIKDLFEAKQVLELRAVELALRNLNDAHVADLRDAMRQIHATPLDAIEEEARLHAAIRRTVAEAAGNPALAIFTQGLNRITHKLLPERSLLSRMTEAHRKERQLREGQVEALIGGDLSRAQQATIDELALAQEHTERNLKRFHQQAHRVEELGRAGGVPHVSPWDAQDKLPHRLGAAIALDISQRRLAPGSKIGSEPEFTERFGVSRAVFREAIRLLEGYGIVHARRGHGGGLVVGTPDPALTVSLVSSYLGHSEFERRHFVELLETLWVAAAPLAAQRAPREQTAALLARGQAIDSRKPRLLAETMRAQFRELMQYTGNPALVLIGTTVEGLAQLASLEPLSAQAAEQFKRMHCDVLAAVATGDASLARRAMVHFMAGIASHYGQQTGRHVSTRARKRA